MKKIRIKHWLLLLAIFAMPAAFPRTSSRLLYYGPDSPNIANIMDQADLVRSLPFDGYVMGWDSKFFKDDNGEFQPGMIFQNRRFQEKGFERAMAEADKIAELVDETGIELFPIIWSNPEALDWFDDKAWDNLYHNTRMLLRLAKRAKCKGICFDPESYTGSKPFKFYPENGRSFEETKAMAHQRGADFMQIIAEEFPEALLLTFGTWDWVIRENILCVSEEADRILSKDSWYALIPSFCNGWLETVPEDMRIINATESGYYYTSLNDFLMGQRIQRGRGSQAEKLVDPDLREKFRRHVEGGFGIFIDMFMASGPDGTPNHEALANQLFWALSMTDEYVWFYSERGKFFPKGRSWGDGRTWEEYFPGATDIIRKAMKLNEGENEKFSDNLLKNPGFDKGTEDFTIYQDGWSKAADGVVSYDPDGGRTSGAVRMDGVCSGGLLRTFEIKSGERYRVTAYCKTSGNGIAEIQIRWRNNNAWMNSACKTTVHSTSKDWEKCEFIVESYPGADSMVVFLWSVGHAKTISKSDIVWVDDVEVRRIE